MRKSFIVIVSVIFMMACNTIPRQEGFVIEGKIDSLSAGEIFLSKIVDGKRKVVDTTYVDSTGAFTFNGKSEVPEIVYIQINDTLPWISLFVENSTITVSGSISNLQKVKIAGSVVQEEYKQYKDSVKSVFGPLNDSLRARYIAANKASNKEAVEEIIKEWDALDLKEAQFKEEWIKTHGKSFVTPAIIWTELIYGKEADYLENLMMGLDSTLQKSPYMGLLKARIEVLKKVAIGQPAPDFTQNDPLGNPVSLSSKFGKYLLVDFWASWCGPCRRENPNVVAAYKKFNKKGFDVLGVSYDQDKDSWLKAIKDDQLSWTHVSDLKGWENSSSAIYGIRSIPANVLLDPSGKIIAKDLRGEDLHKKLTELLK